MSNATLEKKQDWRAQLESETDFQVERERYQRARAIDEVRRLSHVSNWQSAFIITQQWAIIVAAVVLAVQSGHWAVYVFSGIVIASRFQCLGVLLHDGAHYLLFTNRFVNDIVCDLFIAFPLGLSTTLYRHDHFIHHRHTHTELDPDVKLAASDTDFQWPKTRLGCISVIVRSIFALNIHRMFSASKAWSPVMNMTRPIDASFPLRDRVLFVLLMAVSYTGFFLSGAIVSILLLFTIPTLSMLNFTNRVRVIAEHMRVPATHELNSTRTVVPNLFERFFFAPYGVSYHIEHHLFPSVPGRNLAKLHRHLMTDDEFRKHAHITKSYSGLLRELLTPAA